MEFDAPIFIFFNDVIFVFLIELLNDLGLKQGTGAAKVTEEAVVVLLNPMKFEPFGHEADLRLDVVLEEQSFIFIPHDQTNVEMDLLAQSLILYEAFSDHEHQSYDVSEYNNCCKSEMHKDS